MSARRIALALLAVLILAGCDDGKDPMFQGWVEAELIFVGPDEAGRVETLSVREGDQVALKAPLFTVDPDLQLADVAMQEAAVKNAQQAYDRAQALLKTQSGTQRTLDEAEAALRTAQARLNSAQTRLARRVGARSRSVRVLLALNAPLGDDLAADALRGVNLTHKTLVAQRLPRRNHKRQRGKAPAGAGPDRKTAGALRQKTEPRAGAIIDLDPADPAVRIGIELDRDIVRIARGRAFRYLDKAGGAANAERRGRRRYFQVAGLGDGGGNEGYRALGDIEQRGVLLAAVFIDKIVDRDLRVGGEIERGGVVEGDAERGIRRCLQHVIAENVVLQLERD